MEKLDIFGNDKEKEDYIEIIKLNYYNFLKKPRGTFNRLDEIVNDHQKKEYVAVFQELIDTSLPKIQCLTEEETDLVRKWIGVSKEEYTSVDKLANDLGLTYSVTDRKIKEAYFHIIHRILRGFVDLKEAVLNGDISKDEICNLPIDIFEELSPKMCKCISYLDGKRIDTIGDLINNSIETIQNKRNFGSKSLKILVDFIHSLGLSFKDEINYEDEKKKQIDDWHNYVGFNDNMDSYKYDDYTDESEIRKLIRLKLLLEELKIISKQDEIYDKEISKIMIKKQELQKSKMKILDEMLSLQPEIALEEENDGIKKVIK